MGVAARMASDNASPGWQSKRDLGAAPVEDERRRADTALVDVDLGAEKGGAQALRVVSVRSKIGTTWH